MFQAPVKQRKEKKRKETNNNKKLTQDTAPSENIFQEGSDNQSFLR